LEELINDLQPQPDDDVTEPIKGSWAEYAAMFALTLIYLADGTHQTCGGNTLRAALCFS